jgi:hypothetical protein
MADDQLPEIRRVRISSLTIYEISESELDTLGRGSPDSVFLTFAVFLLSVAISFSVVLATLTITSDRGFQVLVILTLIGYLGGLILLAVWWRNHQSTKAIIESIRNRLLPEGEQIQE